MRKDRRSKNLFQKGQLWKLLRVRTRWGLRRLRRFLGQEPIRNGIAGSFARRIYFSVAVLLAVAALTVVSAGLCNEFVADEQVLLSRLYDSTADLQDPVTAALQCFGSSNRIQIALTTDGVDPLKPQKAHLDRGNINLVLTLKDGQLVEYTLKNRNVDTFESGQTNYFTLSLPREISPFDITEYKLTLMPDAKGNYGSWRCRTATVSCLLGGERMILARQDWGAVFAFDQKGPSSVLKTVAPDDDYYSQVSELYPYVLQICTNKHQTVHTRAMKADTLRALGMGDGDVLHLDLETVGLETQNQLLAHQLGTVELPELDQLDYDGTMTLRVRFYSDAAGSYYKDYTLDTPGKDDFELGSSSSFALNMPEGMSVFDIRSLELLVHDADDAWAPRLIRAYLRTDYGFMLELARETDVTLQQKRGTAVFYKGLIETQISTLPLDLTADYQLPAGLKTTIEKQFITQVSGVTYSMYFNEFNFYERQKLFYSQMLALYGENQA